MDAEQQLYWRDSATNAVKRIDAFMQDLAIIGLSGDKVARAIVERVMDEPQPVKSSYATWESFAEAIEGHGAMIDDAMQEIAQTAKKSANVERARIALARHRDAGGAHWGERAA